MKMQTFLCSLIASGLASAASIAKPDLQVNAAPQAGQAASSGLSSLLPKSLTGEDPGTVGSAVAAGKAKVGSALGLDGSGDSDSKLLGRFKDALGGETGAQSADAKKKKKAAPAKAKDGHEGYSIRELVEPYLPEEAQQVYANAAGILADAGSVQNKRALRGSLLQSKVVIDYSIDLISKMLEAPEEKSTVNDIKNLATSASNVLNVLKNQDPEVLEQLALDPGAFALATKASMAALNATVAVLKNSHQN